MPYIRMSLMKPLAGRGERVEQLNRELVSLYRSFEGCQACYLVRAADGSEEVGRVSVWEREEDADRAASDDRSLALRSQLHLEVAKGHLERSFLAQ